MNLALKYRPKDFSDVIGQNNIVGILSNQLKTGNVKQAYLFTGPAGDGKTTTARILANALNEGKGGITEIDAASNNGVDNIRELRDNVKFKPMDTKYRIYIIDEVHMLSIGAFNGLLKTLEEPPKHGIFILCTTDPQKIPATILSRCQRFDFKRISVNDIVARLNYIIGMENQDLIYNLGGDQDAVADPEWAKQEGISLIECDNDALDYIAKLANGGMRNAISMLDTCVGYKAHLTVNDVTSILGTADYEVMFELTEAIAYKNEEAIISIIEDLYNFGRDLKLFINQYCEFLVDVRKYQVIGSFDYIKIGRRFKAELDSIAGKEEKDAGVNIMPVLKTIIDLAAKVKFEANVKPYFEGELMCLCLS